jgi:hypothetical protein
MSELATRNTTDLDVSAPAVMGAPTAAVVDLQAWAMELSAAHQLGTALCKTAFVPKDFQGKPDAAAAAILAGKSLGMDPLSALQNIFVIHGRPGLYARTMHALVIAQGHEVIRTSASPDSVTVAARRKGTADWQEFTWTMARADQAGYVKTNQKYKDNPVEMLTAKAISEACRVIAPDVLTGVAAYAVEELEDMGERPKPAPQQTGSALAALQATAPAPAPEAGPEHEPTWEDLADLAKGDTEALRALWKSASDNGAAAETLEYISNAAKES